MPYGICVFGSVLLSTFIHPEPLQQPVLLHGEGVVLGLEVLWLLTSSVHPLNNSFLGPWMLGPPNGKVCVPKQQDVACVRVCARGRPNLGVLQIASNLRHSFFPAWAARLNSSTALCRHCTSLFLLQGRPARWFATRASACKSFDKNAFPLSPVPGVPKHILGSNNRATTGTTLDSSQHLQLLACSGQAPCRRTRRPNGNSSSATAQQPLRLLLLLVML